MKHFLSISELDTATAEALIHRAGEMKRSKYRSNLLQGKIAAMIFEKTSTRTRVSFEVGIRHLGGDVIFMTPADSQLGRGEPIKDTARVLSRYVDGLVVRTFEQQKLEELAEYGSIPVINALSDMYHPCQVMSDLLTMYEKTLNLHEYKVAWVGDGNNMANSWINAAALFPFELSLAVPEGYDPDAQVLEKAVQAGAKITVTRDPKEAVKDALFVHTDVWASMGQEEEAADRLKIFRKYQVNAELMAQADPLAMVMHCLPAHRGEEISDEVMESKASIVWDQAENRLHMQKAIMERIYTNTKTDQ